MNIFFLSLCHEECATFMVDRHVVKMILEYTQLLCTAHHVLDGPNENLYKPTHINHPCAIWVRSSIKNYMWLVGMLYHLMNEYTFRYNRIHACSVLYPIIKHAPDNITLGKFTEPPLAMPDKYKGRDFIQSYRLYYIHEKSHLHAWKMRKKPDFII